MSQTILRTIRTTVERITIEDAPFFTTLVNTSDWRKYIGDCRVATDEDAQRYLRRGFLKSYQENRFGYYLIRVAAQPIGICGFLKKDHLQNPDFGFALLPEFYGQGYALEACLAVLEYGRETFQFPTLDAVARQDNVRSLRLLEKLDFCFVETREPESADSPLLAIYRWHNS